MCESRHTNAWGNSHCCRPCSFPKSFLFNQPCSFSKTAECLNLWLKSYLTFLPTYVLALSAVKWRLNSAMFVDGAHKWLESAHGKLGMCSTQQCPRMDFERGEERKKEKNTGSSCNHSADIRCVSSLDVSSSDQTTLCWSHFFFFFTPMLNALQTTVHFSGTETQSAVTVEASNC